MDGVHYQLNVELLEIMVISKNAPWTKHAKFRLMTRYYLTPTVKLINDLLTRSRKTSKDRNSKAYLENIREDGSKAISIKTKRSFYRLVVNKENTKIITFLPRKLGAW